MSIVTVSTKFVVVIPKDIRKLLKIHVGQKFRVRVKGERIEFTPELPMSAARGFLQGIDTQIEREKDQA
jgi:AbrB family looped-hinge helix DNA binding protein